MRSTDVVVDSSPLYALIDRRDGYHQRMVAFIERRCFRLLTTLAAITEVAYLLRASRESQLAFLRWVRAGGVQIIDLTDDDLDHSIDIMVKYGDLRPDFADATLVAIADRLQINRIATFDRDFDVYRYRNRARFRNVLR